MPNTPDPSLRGDSAARVRQHDRAAVRGATSRRGSSDGELWLAMAREPLFRENMARHARRELLTTWLIVFALFGLWLFACSFDSHSSEGSNTAWGVER